MYLPVNERFSEFSDSLARNRYLEAKTIYFEHNVRGSSCDPINLVSVDETASVTFPDVWDRF